MMKVFFTGFFLSLLNPFLGICQLDSTKFRHHYIANPLPDNGGTGGFALADYDQDGDLDITISRNSSGKVYWYENQGANWSEHYLGLSDDKQLGASAADINRDGYPDLVMGRYWFRNPGILKKSPGTLWQRHAYAGPLQAEVHDIVVVDLDNDGARDVLCYSQGAGTLRWYNTTDPDNWKFRDIASGVNELVSKDTRGIHGGFAPGGVGDLDKDGYADIALPHGWYKNPGKSNQVWKLMPWPFPIGKTPNLYGLSMRSWICDLDSDGDQDIVYTDSDVEGSGGYWIENRKKGKKFIRRTLPAPGNQTGSFHSLAIADFDRDGDLDIFSGEQEAPNMKPRGMKERGFFWENTGRAKRPSFTIRIIQVDNPGWHEAQAGDVDADGDLDIVSKIWRKDGEHYHADFWENLMIKK